MLDLDLEEVDKSIAKGDCVSDKEKRISLQLRLLANILKELREIKEK